MFRNTAIAQSTLAFVLIFLLLEIPGESAFASSLPSFDRVRILVTPKPVRDLELTDQQGEEFWLSQLQGRVALIFFGFTNCPDVCPTTMAQWAKFEKSGVIETDDVEFVLISVDGERDTPEAIMKFLANFSPTFIGLTADPGKIKPLVRQFSAAFYKDSPTSHGGHYNVSHSPQAFVLDRSGSLRAEFYNPTEEAMAAVIQALLDEPVATQSNDN